MIRRHSDLPLERDSSSRFLPWVIAFMIYLATLSLAAAMIFGSSVSRWGSGLSGTMTVQILPGAEGADVLDAQVALAIKVLQGTPGVEGIRALAPAEIRALLEPWLGSGAVSADLPLPRLIDVTVDRAVAIDVKALARRLDQVAPGALVDDHREWLGDLLVLVRAVEWISAGIVLLTGFIAVLTVVFATRSGLAVHHHVIELLHLIGARDRYVARQFQYHAFKLGLRGGVIGLVLAAATLYAVAYFAGRIEARLLPELAFTPVQWAILATPTVVTAVIAMFTARVTVLRALARMP